MGYMCVATFVSLMKEQNIACFMLLYENEAYFVPNLPFFFFYSNN